MGEITCRNPADAGGSPDALAPRLRAPHRSRPAVDVACAIGSDTPGDDRCSRRRRRPSPL